MYRLVLFAVSLPATHTGLFCLQYVTIAEFEYRYNNVLTKACSKSFSPFVSYFLVHAITVILSSFYLILVDSLVLQYCYSNWSYEYIEFIFL